jgi:hypothetical protein
MGSRDRHVHDHTLSIFVLLAFLSGPAAANEPAAGEVVARKPPLKTPAQRKEPRQDIEDIERFVEENPDAVLNMSHLKDLDPELAQALICSDYEPRAVTHRHKVRYYVAVPTTTDGAPSEKREIREKDVEQSVTIRGNALYLNGLESLSAETASVLASHNGELHLNGLKSLLPEVAAEFAAGGGVDCLLSLDALETLDEESASLLGESFWGLSLKGVKRLSQQAYDAIVQRSGLFDGKEAEQGDEAGARIPPVAWLPPDVLIERPIGHGPMVSVQALAPRDTLAGYVRHLSQISGTVITIDDEAGKILGSDAEKVISLKEWRAMMLGQRPWVLTTPRWAPVQGAIIERRHGSVFGVGDPLLAVEEVVDLLLNMLDPPDQLVVLRGEDGVLVTKQNAILQLGEGVKLEPNVVRVRLSSGEEAFMEKCGSTPWRGFGGGAF